MGFQTGKFDFINSMISKKYMIEINKINKDLNEMGYKDSEVEANLFMATLDGIMFQVIVMGEIIPVDKMKNALLKKYSRTKNEKK